MYPDNSLLFLSDFVLGISFSNLMYSNICIVIFGSNWSMWLWKCLATVELLLCLMSKKWPWNLSVTLFLVCPTYLMWRQLHSRSIFGLSYILDVAPVVFTSDWTVTYKVSIFQDSGRVMFLSSLCVTAVTFECSDPETSFLQLGR